MQKSSPKSMVGGMTVLGITGIVCKLVGVLFSIPLAWLIGAEGLGVYQAVYPTYNMLLTISSAGLPVAVSRMVSGYLARSEEPTAKRVFHVALCLLGALGCVCSLVMLICSGQLSAYVKQPDSRAGFLVIAPCVMIVCVLSAFRGYFQGHQNMMPTAISQLIEQVGKVLVSLPLAYLGAQRSVALGAAGALLGITIVEVIALLFMVVLYCRRRTTVTGSAILSSRRIARNLVSIAVPITIGSCIVPLASFIDSTMLVDRMMVAGLTHAQATSLYGVFEGLVIRLINIPTALALSISMSLVPAVSAAVALNDRQQTIRQSDLGMRFGFLIGLPCSVGMSLLSEHIIRFFYERTLNAEELRIASELLAVSSLTVVLFTGVQATTAILQGVQKQRIPMYTLVAGVVFKIALNYLLIGTPGIDIHGGPIASMVCYTVSLLPNIYFCLRYTGMPFNWQGWLLRPGLATLAMGLVVWGLRSLLPISHLTTLLLVAIGVAVYLAAALLFKAVTPNDFSALRRKRRA